MASLEQEWAAAKPATLQADWETAVPAPQQTGGPLATAGVAALNFALGAASPFIGVAQGIAALLGDKEKALEFGKKLQEGKRQMREYAYGKEAGGGFSPAEFAGTVLSPVGLAAAKALPAATKIVAGQVVPDV